MASRMHKIWREAAELEMSGDYYPITKCRGDARDWYAMQFDHEEEKRGFVQVIRNTLAEEERYLLRLPCVCDGAAYTLCDRESGKSFTYSASELREGIEIILSRRIAVINFYTYR